MTNPNLIETWDYQKALGISVYDKFACLFLKIIQTSNSTQNKITHVRISPVIQAGFDLAEIKFQHLKIIVDGKTPEDYIFLGNLDDEEPQEPQWLSKIYINNFSI